jgi:hypothetical protein
VQALEQATQNACIMPRSTHRGRPTKSYTVFNFNDVGANAELIGLDGKNSYYDGEFYREGAYAGAWYAEKS